VKTRRLLGRVAAEFAGKRDQVTFLTEGGKIVALHGCESQNIRALA
jgi:hypothetical protein